jgi:hypothetical protein
MQSKNERGSSARRDIISIDPEMWFTRKLHYDEKHSAWHIFKSLFWAVYIFIAGVMLYDSVPTAQGIMRFFGSAVVVLSIFLILYGFSKSLHLKLMKKYA